MNKWEILLAVIGGIFVVWFVCAFAWNFLVMLMLWLFFRGNNGDPLGCRMKGDGDEN